MKFVDPRTAAKNAAISNPSRPAAAVVLETPDARLVVFRLKPGQSLPPHRSASSVLLTVLHGEGFLSGGDGERRCGHGEMVAFAPNELHGMRAADTELHLLATIAPSPAARWAGCSPVKTPAVAG